MMLDDLEPEEALEDDQPEDFRATFEDDDTKSAAVAKWLERGAYGPIQ